MAFDSEDSTILEKNPVKEVENYEVTKVVQGKVEDCANLKSTNTVLVSSNESNQSFSSTDELSQKTGNVLVRNVRSIDTDESESSEVEDIEE
eukprot:Awhi_evm1s11341